MEVSKAALIPLIFNHLNWNPSYHSDDWANFKLDKWACFARDLEVSELTIIVTIILRYISRNIQYRTSKLFGCNFKIRFYSVQMIPKTVPIVPNFEKHVSKLKILCAKLWQNFEQKSIFYFRVPWKRRIYNTHNISQIYKLL